MFILLLALFSSIFIVQATEVKTRGNTNHVTHGNFVQHKDYKLVGNSELRKVFLEAVFDCLIQCSVDTECRSTNVNTTSNVQGLLECVLLDFDKHENDGKLIQVKGVDHYAMPSKCDEKPCQHDGKCIPVYVTYERYYCKCIPGYKGNNCETTVFSNCAQFFTAGYNNSGVYLITLPVNTTKVLVYCDMTTSGGGWTVFQKRQDGSVDFYRGWSDYKKGFGNKLGEYWLGLDNIHSMTSHANYRLRVDLEDFEGNTRYAEYGTLHVASETLDYKLAIGSYSGTAGDSLRPYSNNQRFSTKDRDNDFNPGSCARMFKGAWWYNNCHGSNLNGLYLKGTTDRFAVAVVWHRFRSYYYSLKRAEMKIRPTNFGSN